MSRRHKALPPRKRMVFIATMCAFKVAWVKADMAMLRCFLGHHGVYALSRILKLELDGVIGQAWAFCRVRRSKNLKNLDTAVTTGAYDNAW